MMYIIVFLLVIGVILLSSAPGNILDRLSDMGLALIVSSIVLYASHVRDERPETNRRVFRISGVIAVIVFFAMLIIRAYLGGISMGIEQWALVLSGLGIVATVVIAVLIYKWTRRRTDEIIEFAVNLIVNSAGDPDTVRRLLDDYEKTGKWRGKVTRGDGNVIHIDWEP
jgi:hypothetical protein